jgi:hypothetical protein
LDKKIGLRRIKTENEGYWNWESEGKEEKKVWEKTSLYKLKLTVRKKFTRMKREA